MKKRLLSIALAVAMIFALSSTALAFDLILDPGQPIDPNPTLPDLTIAQRSNADIEFTWDSNLGDGIFRFAETGRFLFPPQPASLDGFTVRTIAETVDEVYTEGVTLTVTAARPPVDPENPPNAPLGTGGVYVSMRDFTIGNYVTMAGFELYLIGDQGATTGDGSTYIHTTDDGDGLLIVASPAGQPAFLAQILSASAVEGSWYTSAVAFHAYLTAQAGTAYRVGTAQAQLTWTSMSASPTE